jgi:small subunit ribosomal protein S6
MTLPAPTYDLVLLLDPQAEDDTRAKIVADTLSAVEAQGELLRHDEWGERPLAYPIEKKASAEYHLLQFHVGDVELLASLSRTLRITDGVVRSRIIKLKPGVPDAPDMRSSTPAVARRPESDRSEIGEQAQAPAVVEAPPADVEGAPEAAVGEPA